MQAPPAFSPHKQTSHPYARSRSDVSASARTDASRKCFAGQMRRTGVHTSLSGVAFFSLCCSNRSAVHVDSRLHCSDNRHLTNGLGGQHGEEGSYEVEDQVCVEEDSDEDQGEVHRQKEEVRQRSTFDFEECRCVRHTSRRLESGSALDTAGSVTTRASARQKVRTSLRSLRQRCGSAKRGTGSRPLRSERLPAAFELSDLADALDLFSGACSALRAGAQAE